MTIRIPEPQYQPVVVLRAAGYSPFQDPKSREASFVRRLGTHFYPRFHIYVRSDSDEELLLTLHLDMKQPSYHRQKKHSGEYEGKQLKEERERILRRIPK